MHMHTETSLLGHHSVSFHGSTSLQGKVKDSSNFSALNEVHTAPREAESPSCSKPCMTRQGSGMHTDQYSICRIWRKTKHWLMSPPRRNTLQIYKLWSLYSSAVKAKLPLLVCLLVLKVKVRSVSDCG